MGFNLTKKDGKRYLILNYNYNDKDWIKNCFEEREWDPDNRVWIAPATVRNVNLVLDKEGRADPFHRKVKTVPGEFTSSKPLWSHQQRIFDHILSKRQAIVAAEPRTGKTLPTLEACVEFIKSVQGEATKSHTVLWLSTVSGCKSTLRELDRWYGTDPTTGKTKYPLKIVVTTYDTWVNRWPETGFRPQCVILDEFHTLKTPDSNRGRAARSIYGLLQEWYDEDFLLVGMSGTPAPKEPTDWHNLVETICPGYIPEATRALLQSRLAVEVEMENEYGMKYRKVAHWKEYAVADFAKELEGISLTLLKKDVLDLPEKVHTYVELEPDEDTLRAIQIVQETVPSKIQIIQRLRQISDGFIYAKTVGDSADMEENERNCRWSRSTGYLESPKLRQLEEDCNNLLERGINRVTVFAGYKASVGLITNFLLKKGWGVIQADGAGWRALGLPFTDYHTGLSLFDRSQAGGDLHRTYANTPIAFVANPKTASTGIELSMCPVVIYYSHTDNGEAEFQSLERAHSNNMDKEAGLEVRHYVHVETDRLIIDNLIHKRSLQSISMGEIVGAMQNVTKSLSK